MHDLIQFWRNKRVLVTGHTGFKGSWLSLWLQHLGATVFGVALAPTSSEDLFHVLGLESLMSSHLNDIRNYDALCALVREVNPEIVFHLAAQPLVLRSYENPRETYSTNVLGTLNVLEAARHHSNAKVFVNVTSDKCYQNKKWPWAYREEEALGGHDPYSSSKACAEILTSSYRSSYLSNSEASMALASARAGNCIGGGDWSADRLIPDLMRALTRGIVATIRSPLAVRPWQHVLEPLHGYLRLAQKLWEEPPRFSDAWNFGPDFADTKSVAWIAQYLQQKSALQVAFAPSPHHPHEAHVLRVDNTKSQLELGWKPVLTIEHTLDWVLAWYERYRLKQNMLDFSLAQINAFTRQRDLVENPL